MSKKEHRGRIQAQGEGLEASESWAQDEPLTKKEGLSLLRKLKAKLSSKDRKKREKQFEEAERFIKGIKGGIQSPERLNFQDRKTKDVRVDIEVWSGFAFVAITFLILALLWKML